MRADEDSVRSVVALVDADTAVERRLVGEWLAAGGLERELRIGAPVTQLELDRDVIAERLLIRGDDPLVVPIRVLWLPPERDGVRRTTLKDIATLSNPRSPNGLQQRRIVRSDPGRHVVLTGAPARLSELRQRYGNDGVLARGVKRAAVLALERAERLVIGDRYKVPRLVAEEIVDSPRFRARLDEIAEKAGIGRGLARRRGEKALRGLVAAQSRLVSDLFTQAMRPVHASTWAVQADEVGLARLRALNREYPLVFLPSHRSYVDAFVLGDVLAGNDFPPNHLVGGANLSFWPVGPIARRTGAIFIRRSFGDDEVYKAAVEEYIGYLLAKRFNLEWYFEGGRTRTGKLRPPRYGLFNYLAAAVRSGRVDDVMLVPVSITYERLNELGAIAAEQLGGDKQPEGLAWMAKYIRNQRHSAGSVYVRFGEPLSAAGRLAAHGDHPGADTATARAAVQRVAFDVAVSINRATPVTVNALVALALLGVRARALTLAEVGAVLAPVLRYIERRRLPRGELETLRTESGLAVVLDQLTVAKVVTAYRGGLEPVYTIENGQHLIAAFYRNSAVHWFVNRAILELSLLAVKPDSEDPIGDGTREALRLRDLLKFEFFFPSRTEYLAELAAEMELIVPDWAGRELTRGQLLEALRETGFFMVHRTLRSFFDAQLVVAELLVMRNGAQDRKVFIEECVAVGRQRLLQGKLHSTESVSSELFTTALRLADHLGLADPVAADSDPGRDEMAGRRRAFCEELRAIGDRVSQAALLDDSNRKDDIDGG
ncbi:MAG: glycerol-3-phosphate 1-O-acyltransferase [Mycobacteriaceae bacterium]|nr:glycerol-3-phosphate 1-O-acyltransferase [Mycobacteriaceae bacterium]